jgi:hypothetical protein
MSRKPIAAIAAVLLSACAVQATLPVDAGPGKHPRIASALEHCRAAYQDMAAARDNHDGGMGGHARDAMNRLEQACREIELARAELDDDRGRR